MDTKDKVVFLAFRNPNAPTEQAREVTSCGNCRNKTFVIAHYDEGFPAIECACCGQHIGRMGWASND